MEVYKKQLPLMGLSSNNDRRDGDDVHNTALQLLLWGSFLSSDVFYAASDA